MRIREVIETINQMRRDGVIDNYAVGGAVGATFYLEPVATLDLDVFVEMHIEHGSAVISPKPIFDYLTARNCKVEGEYILIAGWPVQFLPPTSPLVQEALEEAVEKDIDGISARVVTAEHIAAIALETGRAKDKARLLQFIEEGSLDMKRFQAIITHHGLDEPWKKFEQQFLGSES